MDFSGLPATLTRLQFTGENGVQLIDGQRKLAL